LRSHNSTSVRLDGGLVRRHVGTSPSSKRLLQLLAKEWRELFASRSFWLLMLITGLLVGHGFITAVGLYAEASGSGGGPAALAQGLTPLDGILVPTFGAYDLAAMFLFPFVAIRAIAAEKQSGGLKLLLQLPGSLATKVAAKVLVLLGGWLVTLLPGLTAIALWKSYGGHLYAPETLNLMLGHLLRTLLSAGIAIAAAAIAENQRRDRNSRLYCGDLGVGLYRSGPRRISPAVGCLHSHRELALLRAGPAASECLCGDPRI